MSGVDDKLKLRVFEIDRQECAQKTRPLQQLQGPCPRHGELRAFRQSCLRGFICRMPEPGLSRSNQVHT